MNHITMTAGKEKRADGLTPISPIRGLRPNLFLMYTGVGAGAPSRGIRRSTCCDQQFYYGATPLCPQRHRKSRLRGGFYSSSFSGMLLSSGGSSCSTAMGRCAAAHSLTRLLSSRPLLATLASIATTSTSARNVIIFCAEPCFAYSFLSLSFCSISTCFVG